MLLVGLDVGTTTVKAAVFDEKGQQLSVCIERYQTHLTDGRRELLGEEIWRCSQKVLREAFKPHSGLKEAALAVSSFGEGFVCLDRNGEILTPVMLLTDDRGESEFQQAVSQIGEDKIIKICGLKPHPSYSVSKLLYLKSNHSDIFQKIHRVLLIGDFMNYKLCGKFATDGSLASRTMLFDINQRRWSKELLNWFGFPTKWFGEAVCAGTRLGSVSAPLAELLGLPEQTEVVMGGHDQACCAVAAYGIHPKIACSMGTSICLTPVLKQPLDASLTKTSGFPCAPFLKDGWYHTLAYNVTSGRLIDWFIKTVLYAEQKAEADIFSFLEREMPPHPTSIMVLPYLMGTGTPYLDSSARLAFLGIGDRTQRGDLYRALLEGIALDLRLNLERLGNRAELEREVVAMGGGSRSKIWIQIIADVLGKPVSTLSCDEGGALGCAILCAAALGLYPSLEKAAGAMAQIKDRFEPRQETKKIYDEKYAAYQGLHQDCIHANRFAAYWEESLC